MTIASQTSRISYTGDGSTTVFAVPFYFQANIDIVVYLQDTLGNITLQALGTNYTLTGATLANGGTATFTVAPTVGYIVTILRDPPITQTASYNNNDPFPAKSHEGALDKATTIDQRTRDIVTRSLRTADGDATLNMVLPPAAVRKNQALGFDATGLPALFNPSSAVTASENITFIQAGIGARSRTVKDKDRDIFSVLDFAGVDPTGVTDSSVGIQAALDAVSLKGRGSLWFPSGSYTAVGLTYTGGSICMFGDGPGTIINIANTTGTLLTGSGDIDICDMAIQHPTQGASTAGFFFSFSSAHANLRNVHFFNGFKGVRFGSGCNQCGMFNVTSYAIKNDFIEVDVSAAIPPAAQSGNITLDCVSSQGTSNNTGIGLHLISADGVYVSDCLFGGFQNGIIAAPSASRSYLANLFFTNVVVDGAGGPALAGPGILFDGTNNPLLRVFISNSWVSFMRGSNGVQILNTKMLSWTNGSVLDNGVTGIVVDNGALDILLSNLVVSGNSSSSSGSNDGILVFTGADKVRIKNCRIGPAHNGTDASTQTNSQRYGILVSNSGTTNYEIIGNDVSGNVLGGILDAGGTSGNRIVKDNIGYAAADIGYSDAWTAYTPTITATSGTFTTVSATGRYKQIGKTVYFENKITITTNGSAAGGVVGTLPVTVNASGILTGVGRENTSTGNMVQVYAGGGSATYNAFTPTNTYPGGSGTSLHISGTYEAA